MVYEGNDTIELTSIENNVVNIALHEPKLNLQNFLKTEFVTVIPKGTTLTINCSDENYSTYYSGDESRYKGAFIEGRANIELSPFAMCKYEVTQELYEEVMGNNPSNFIIDIAVDENQKYRPVEKITWNQAILFCNELTKKTMSNDDCVYYSDTILSTIYSAVNAEAGDTVYINT